MTVSIPRILGLDMTIYKRTRITERQDIEFRLEMQNMVDTPLFGLPDSAIIPSSAFGRMRGPVVSAPRRMQLALKCTF